MHQEMRPVHQPCIIQILSYLEESFIKYKLCLKYSALNLKHKFFLINLRKDFFYYLYFFNRNGRILYFIAVFVSFDCNFISVHFINKLILNVLSLLLMNFSLRNKLNNIVSCTLILKFLCTLAI